MSYFFLTVKVGNAVAKKAFLAANLQGAVQAAINSGAKVVFAPTL